jgi:hypothetical protein
MKETFEDYLQRLKDRRTEDDYKYTDEDFTQYEEYIRDCCKSGMSVYKCLEFMYFAEKDMDDQLFNREPRQELGILEVPMPISKREIQPEQIWNDEKKEGLKEFIDKHKQDSRNFLPGFIEQFDPNEGEINGEEWTAVHFLKWLELNNFKIVK